MRPRPDIPGAVDTDTIAAVATAPGRGGIGVVRVSGPAAPAVARALIGAVPAPRRATVASFRDAGGEVMDHGLVLYFERPASFTGEEVLELQGHGGAMVLDLVLARVLEAGARRARPGEFTERAFLNGKLDLAQAEAVLDLIDGSTRASVRGAMRSLSGEFSHAVTALDGDVVELRTYVEASIDFPEEEVDFLTEGDVGARLAAIAGRIDELLRRTRQGVMLADGVTLVIAGRPNAGKSSLLNRLAGRERAIVTAVPGTTRDLLDEHISLDGLPARIVDTAGLRISEDPVEREGVKRALAEIADADLVLLVRDPARDEPATVLAEELGLPRDKLVVLDNKCDLTGATPGVDGTGINLSALTGAGVDELVRHLRRRLGAEESLEGAFTARSRHLEALRRASGAIEAARECLARDAAGELVAEELRRAHGALGEIVGATSSDDLLGRIFSSFCIGK